jgi:hypothetical protein
MQAAESLINQAVRGMFPGTPFDPKAQSINLPPPRDFFKPTISGSNDVPLEYSSAFQVHNYTVSYDHTMSPWRDSSDLNVSAGALVFHQKHGAKTGDHFYADCTLATLNKILYEAYERYKADGAPNNIGLGDVNFEKKYAAYRYLKREGFQIPEEMEKYKKLDDFEYRYLAAYNIVELFTFLGVCLSRNDTTDNPDVYTNYYRSRHVSNIGFVPQGEVKVANIWGGPLKVKPGSMLYLALVKKDKGHFRIEPYVSEDGRPPLEDGVEFSWYVGRVKYETTQTPAPHSVERAIFNKDPVNAYKAVEELPRILINVGI